MHRHQGSHVTCYEQVLYNSCNEKVLNNVLHYTQGCYTRRGIRKGVPLVQCILECRWKEVATQWPLNLSLSNWCPTSSSGDSRRGAGDGSRLYDLTPGCGVTLTLWLGSGCPGGPEQQHKACIAHNIDAICPHI